ncbi:hypothetical protein GCM10027269_16780 [Kribbella endophytica]
MPPAALSPLPGPARPALPRLTGLPAPTRLTGLLAPTRFAGRPRPGNPAGMPKQPIARTGCFPQAAGYLGDRTCRTSVRLLASSALR